MSANFPAILADINILKKIKAMYFLVVFSRFALKRVIQQPNTFLNPKKKTINS